MHKKSVLAVICLLFLLISTIVVSHTAFGWIHPSDINEREYYPGSNFYPPKFYEIYAAKYARVYARDIVLTMPYGHHIKVGTLLFTITPLQSISGDAETTVKDDSREFLMDVEIIYNADSYFRNEPAVRYLDEPDGYNHYSWELPPINAFYLEKIRLKADFSQYYSSSDWSFSGRFEGTSAANWKGNGN